MSSEPARRGAPEMSGRLARVLALGVGAIALIGFVTGTRSTSRERGRPRGVVTALATSPHAADVAGLSLAPRHADLASDAHRRTDARQAASFARLVADRPGVTAPAPVDASRGAAST